MGHGDAESHPESDLEGAPPLLSARRHEHDQRRDGSEDGRLVAQETSGELVGESRSCGSLQYHRACILQAAPSVRQRIGAAAHRFGGELPAAASLHGAAFRGALMSPARSAAGTAQLPLLMAKTVCGMPARTMSFQGVIPILRATPAEGWLATLTRLMSRPSPRVEKP